MSANKEYQAKVDQVYALLEKARERNEAATGELRKLADGINPKDSVIASLAQESMGYLYLDGPLLDQATSDVAAAKYFQMAYRNGNVDAGLALATMYFRKDEQLQRGCREYLGATLSDRAKKGLVIIGKSSRDGNVFAQIYEANILYLGALQYFGQAIKGVKSASEPSEQVAARATISRIIQQTGDVSVLKAILQVSEESQLAENGLVNSELLAKCNAKLKNLSSQQQHATKRLTATPFPRGSFTTFGAPSSLGEMHNKVNAIFEAKNPNLTYAKEPLLVGIGEDLSGAYREAMIKKLMDTSPESSKFKKHIFETDPVILAKELGAKIEAAKPKTVMCFPVGGTPPEGVIDKWAKDLFVKSKGGVERPGSKNMSGLVSHVNPEDMGGRKRSFGEQSKSVLLQREESQLGI